MTYLEYGPQRKLPDDTDWSLHTNEQFGFVANLVHDTNDVYAFATPYPSGFNLSEQTIKVRAIDYHVQQMNEDLGAMQALTVFLSMLDEELSATFQSLADGDDEEMRAQFDGPIPFGRHTGWRIANAGTSIEPNQLNHNDGPTLYQPRIDELDLLTPLYQQFTTATWAPVEPAETLPQLGSFTKFEETWYRLWWGLRDLTSAEKSMRGNQLQWMRLNS